MQHQGEPSLSDLTKMVKQKAKDLGFDLVGIAHAADPALAEETVRYQEWLNAGRGASMQYLHRHSPIKAEPSQFLAGVRSVISVGMIYGVEKQPGLHELSESKVSIYSFGPDYHEVLGQRLTQLTEALAVQMPHSQSRIYVDKEPVLDRFWAWRAGLGWLGKNTCLINRKVGSFVFLGGVMTTIPFVYDNPQPDHCGRCTKCIEACPTGALVAPRVLDAGRCIAYHTIENKGLVPAEVAEKSGAWIAGCDICQDVCPWNDPVTEGRFFPKSNSLYGASLKELQNLNEETYKNAIKGLAISRMKFSMFQRNLNNAEKNADKKSSS